MKRKASIGLIVGVLMTAAPFAVACVRIIITNPGDTENAVPCSGMCGTYIVCPVSDHCSSGYWTGLEYCGAPTPTSLHCQVYRNGTANSHGCCTGGTYLNSNANIIVVIRFNSVGPVCDPFGGPN